MNHDVRDLEPVVAPLATVPEPSNNGSAAQRRVQRAKARLTQHITALDLRARTLVRQSAWFAGMVLLGLAGSAVAAAMLGSKSKRGVYRAQRRPGVGTALMLAALGLISQRARRLEPRLGRAYEP